MYEKLPQELKERGSFYLWKYEERDGRMTKVPYQTSGLRADSTNKATFTDYATAISLRDKYDGIGNGRLFADVFKDIARFVPERKQWFIYDGTRWVPDTGALKAMELCKDLADALIVIYWNFIGAAEIPDGQEKTA